MTRFVKNIEKLAQENSNFRQVLFTTQHAQLVVMSLKANEDIGEETHEVTDQFLRIESGEGKVVLSGKEHSVRGGDAIMVPAGTKHNLINTSSDHELRLYTIYSPPHHKDGTIHKTKEDAKSDVGDHL